MVYRPTYNGGAILYDFIPFRQALVRVAHERKRYAVLGVLGAIFQAVWDLSWGFSHQNMEYQLVMGNLVLTHFFGYKFGY